MRPKYAPENAAAFTVQARADDAWRKTALDSLVARGLPTPRLERWKYTNIASFLLSGAKSAEKVALASSPVALPWMLQTSRKFLFVNGKLNKFIHFLKIFIEHQPKLGKIHFTY